MTQLRHRILMAVCIFALVGWFTARVQQQRAATSQRPLDIVMRQVALIQTPLRSACADAATLASQPLKSPQARAQAVAKLQQARTTAAKAEKEFRALVLPPVLAAAPELRQALAETARMAALSGKAIDQAILKVEGHPEAEPRMRALQGEANQAAARAAALFQQAIKKARSTHAARKSE